MEHGAAGVHLLRVGCALHVTAACARVCACVCARLVRAWLARACWRRILCTCVMVPSLPITLQAAQQWVPLAAVTARLMSHCARAVPSAISHRAWAAAEAAAEANSTGATHAAGAAELRAAIVPPPNFDSAVVRAMLRRCFPPGLPKVSRPSIHVRVGVFWVYACMRVRVYVQLTWCRSV